MTEKLPDVARYIDALSSPVSIDEVTGRARGRKGSPARRAMVFAVAVTVVAATSAVIVVALSDRAGEPARTTTAIRPSPASTTTTTSKPATPTSTVTANAVITSVPLGDQAWFDHISTLNRGLLLTGLVPSDSGSNQTCDAATVDPQTLALVHPTVGSCNDAGLSGETVTPVNTQSASGQQCCNATVAIARTDPQTGHVTIGPVVMTYSDGSTSRPVAAYGGDWLWIYDVDTTNGAEVLQVSRSSGKVVNTVKTPKLYKPLLAANDDGLWLANSVQGGRCPGCGPPPTLSFIAPGAKAAVHVAAAGTGDVFWLRATGHHVWAGVGPFYKQQTIVRFDGTGLRPVFQVPERGFDPDLVVGDETGGLWAVVWRSSNPTASNGYDYDVVRIDPDTGRETRFASLPRFELPPNNVVVATPPAASFNGSLFVLLPPYRTNGFLGYSTLIRVTPQN